MGRRRISDETAAVLALFASEPGRERYGLEVLEDTGVASGSLYPILIRLERDGVLAGAWEGVDESEVARRRRRYYKLTGYGSIFAEEALERWRVATRRKQRLLQPRLRSEVP